LSSHTPPKTPTDPDAWPTADEETVVGRSDTLVGGPPPPPPPVAPPDAAPADRRIGAGMLLALGALALVAAGILIAWLLTHRSNDKQPTTVTLTTQRKPTPVPPKVAVPRLIGLKEQQALVRLGQLNLRPKEVFRPTKQPKGVVVSQKPQEATEVRRGGRVTIVVDSGAPKVAVPDLTGASFADAQRKLDQLGLDSTKTEVTSTEAAGTVVDQAPKAGGKIAKGSTVTLSVAKAQPAQTTPTTTAQATTTPTTTSSATTPTTTAAAAPPPPPQPTSATMPDVSGQQEPSAVTALANAGILASLVFVPSKDTLGTVEQQAKPAGSTVPYHSHVQLNLSRGPNNNPLQTVPNVVGQTLQQAVGSLNAAHLRLLYLKFPVTSQAQAGKIVQQSPLSGGQAPQNAQVVVYLGAFKKG
jgi:beta-lactam-binding protein with PASTA domain